uniref:Uncharacterized protein n=1 Tax=Meloidogyne enterolobii TaxID=390850 RepID=A0A6V7WV85_MELEN|nr:unnamed protein product [Meloidogyne enterolobii]
MLFQNYLKTEDSNEAITLDLVENWSVKENQEGQLEQKWHKETLDGLSRLRGLGSFLAEQLSNEADKCDKRWAIARRQRRTLIDSLILALKEESEEGKLKGKEDLNKKLDKLNSLKIEQKYPKRHSSNGWLFKINDDNISYSTTTKNNSNAPSCSSSEIISTKNELPRYEFFENKKVKDKKSEEEADDEIETSGDDDIIYL